MAEPAKLSVTLAPEMKVFLAAGAVGYLALTASLLYEVWRSRKRAKAAYAKVRESVQEFLDGHADILAEEHKKQFREMGYRV